MRSSILLRNAALLYEGCSESGIGCGACRMIAEHCNGGLCHTGGIPMNSELFFSWNRCEVIVNIRMAFVWKS